MNFENLETEKASYIIQKELAREALKGNLILHYENFFLRLKQIFRGKFTELEI